MPARGLRERPSIVWEANQTFLYSYADLVRTPL